ncbi:hypothetical protein GCM10017786_21060 [Amycolatopsis deserti]|uniref:Uncharacterized protein n=1 Tax=Amycolatopsis deserti TaxID=185696 RepID=A0ABQ3IQP8_9PSEU|nr:hypothetical protein [Amycolatopsis deserti]GHE88829.1 hypothetical protein GCM10017786_21060 [Amycolatopsis deserti]
MSNEMIGAAGTSTGIHRIDDLPVFTEIESPDFGADLDWIADDLCRRDYQGLLRHDNLGVVVYRNADLIALGTHQDVSHQDVLNDVEGSRTASCAPAPSACSHRNIGPPSP